MIIIKVKAFTVLEVIISMLLISLVITLTYSSIEIIERQFIRWEKDTKADMECNLFIQALGEDIYKATRNKFRDNELFLEDYEGNRSSYYFKKSGVIRKSGIHIDTFNIVIIPQISFKENNDGYIHLYGLERGDSLQLMFKFPTTQAEKVNKLFFHED